MSTKATSAPRGFANRYLEHSLHVHHLSFFNICLCLPQLRTLILITPLHARVEFNKLLSKISLTSIIE